MSLKSPFFALLLLCSACSVFMPSGPTAVARGEYYAAGKPEFDRFFIELHQHQVTLLEAPGEPKGARESLTKAAGLTPDASDESLSSRLSQELKKSASQGLRVRLEVPEPSAALDASATLHTSEASSQSELRTSLSEAATRLVRSRNRMLATQQLLEKLRVTGIELDGNVDQAFRTDGPWKRDEVRRNLDDGQKVITLMVSRAKEVEEQDNELLALVVSATTTDPNLGKAPAYAPPPTVEADAGAARPAPKRGGTRSTGRPAAKPRPAAPAPKPAPAKPRGDDDAPPAPKPTQGTAPAEIEP